jgi:hypothetical protein
MKPAWISALVLCAFAVGQYVPAEEPDSSRPRWVIIATVIDRSTSKPIGEKELAGRELEFDSAAQCNFVLQKVQAVSNEHVAVILKCSKVAAPGEIL